MQDLPPVVHEGSSAMEYSSFLGGMVNSQVGWLWTWNDSGVTLEPCDASMDAIETKMRCYKVCTGG